MIRWLRWAWDFDLLLYLAKKGGYRTVTWYMYIYAKNRQHRPEITAFLTYCKDHPLHQEPPLAPAFYDGVELTDDDDPPDQWRDYGPTKAA